MILLHITTTTHYYYSHHVYCFYCYCCCYYYYYCYYTTLSLQQLQQLSIESRNCARRTGRSCVLTSLLVAASGSLQQQQLLLLLLLLLLLTTLITATSLVTFRHKLKTFSFRRSYDTVDMWLLTTGFVLSFYFLVVISFLVCFNAMYCNVVL